MVIIIIIIIIIIMVTYSLNKHLLRSCLYKRCPSCIGPIWRLFFLYIQREIELCSMVYPALIPNAMLNDHSSSKREAIRRCNI